MIFFDSSWRGPNQQMVIQRLKDGDPSIRVGSAPHADGIAIIPVNLQDGEEEIVAQRLREMLTTSR